jgi:glycosyltransferase involved in cell wall biosynthesis
MGPSILFVIGDLAVGGTESHLVRVLPGLARTGFHPIVYTLTHRSDLASRIRPAGIELITPPLASTLRSLPLSVLRALLLPITMARLWWLMRRRRPDIVHCFLPAGYLVGGVCALLAGRALRVMSRRSLNAYQEQHRVLARLERQLHRRMSAVLGNSRAVLADLAAEGVPPDRIGLIYNGIETVDPKRLPSRVDVRSRLGIDGAALVLTTVANLIPYKGHGDLLEALAKITGELPAGWVLLCVGRDDGIGPALRARAHALGIDAHVRWLGERHDVLEILHASDIGLLPSHQEGFSNAILEGMAASLPMVVTRVGGNPEAVVDGLTGLVVPPRDPGMMAAAVLELAGDPVGRRRMGEAGRRRVEEVFSLDICVDRYARLYRALAGGPGEPVNKVLAAAASS